MQRHRLAACCHSLRKSVAALVGALALASAPSAVWATEPKVIFDELVHSSDVILVGHVTGQACRLTKDGGAIVTDVTLDVVDLIHRGGNALPVDEQVTITYAGGEVGAVGMSVTGTPRFDEGSDYVLFLLHDGKTYANPVVGGFKGIFPVMQDVREGTRYPVGVEKRGIAAFENGDLRLTAPIQSIAGGEATFRDGQRGGEAALTVEQFKAVITNRLAAPLDHAPVIRRGDARGPQTLELFCKAPDGLADAAVSRRPAAPMVPEFPKESRADLEEAKELGKHIGLDGTGEEAEGALESFDSERATLCACGYHDLNLVMEQVPTGWWSWQPNNDMMALYNQFMDIYRYVPDDGGFGNNGDNEFCGWVDQPTLNSVYGFNWGTSIALCVTYFPSGCPCCELSQADVMLNPAYTFVNSFASALGNSGVINYVPTMIHELGHTWGLQRGSCNEDYSYSRPTVMHAYYWNIVEDGWGLHGWDSYAIRQLYDDQTGVIGRTDIGVEAYRANGSLQEGAANATNYIVGNSITVNNIGVDNMSTYALSGVRLRFYLSTNNIISGGDYQMGSYFEWASFGQDSFWQGSLAMTVPNVPEGDYYVGMIVTRNGASYLSDDFFGNDTTFLRTRIHVSPPPPGNDASFSAIEIPLGSYSYNTSGASTDGRVHGGCQFDGQTYNDIWYSHTPNCDGTLYVSTCNQASYDTDLVIYFDDGYYPPYTYQVLACNDDYAGCSNFSSYVQSYVTAGTRVLIRVGGYQSGDAGAGTFTLGLVPYVPNNNCAGALPIASGSQSFNTTCATTDGVAHAGCQFNGQVYNDVWYSYIADCTGEVTITTCGQANYDTDLAFYYNNGTCPPGSGDLVACNDDAPGCEGYTSSLTANVTEGTAYLVRVGGYVASSYGTGTISISCVAPPCLGDANSDGLISFPDIISILANWGASYSPGTGPGDADRSGLVEFPDIIAVLRLWGNAC